MSTPITTNSHFAVERLVANMITIHEASRHISLRTDLPRHLAATLGASSVEVVFIELNAESLEVRRTSYSTGNILQPSDHPENNWASSLLREASAEGAVQRVERFMPGSAIHALYPVDAATAIAFNIHSPEAVHMLTEEGRDFLVSTLSHIALNLRCQATSTASPVRSMPLLSSLTKAEWRVLLALDGEASEKEISSTLATTANTLHSHIKSIYRRLGVQSRLSAIAILRRAEREALITELQKQALRGAASNAAPSNDQPIANHHPVQPTITLMPVREVQFRPINYLPFVKSDSRAG
jgi:DNA-binding CsgD family transcriptional regulator